MSWLVRQPTNSLFAFYKQTFKSITLMAKRKSAPKTYFTHLKTVLEHWTDPRWLGMHSPLATPYFLGDQLHGTDATPDARGAILVMEVKRSLQTLWRGPLPSTGPAMLEAVDAEEKQQGRGARYDCLILELNYLKRIFQPAPKSQAEIYNDILHISRPTHDRHLAQAVERLGTILLQRLRPAIRPEQPRAASILVGREEQQAEILADLQRGQSVSLIGPGGVGKTALGAALTESWLSPAVFWFTIRATFNDTVDSLLFALGHFLHTQGTSTLWHQLVADGGRLHDGNLALSLIRTDLAALTHRPLLCFDELDVLRTLVADQPNPRHLQMLELLDSLRGHTALLLIGQRAFWESDTLYALSGLTETEIDTLLQSCKVPHNREDVARLHHYSGGNPRLVELCAALYDTATDDSFSHVLDQLPQSPTLLALWHRLARRLSVIERRLLQELAVFRSAAPVDVWQQIEEEYQDAIVQLIGRRLVIQDQQGGLALLPALREVIYHDLPVEQREAYHLHAAEIRTERGEYTAAAYHLHLADQPEAAVTLWYAHRAEEINRGQAGTALAIFEAISQRRLSAKRRKELRLLRSELYQLHGDAAKIVETLEDERWPTDEETTVDAALLLGNALEVQGQTNSALTRYANGINTVMQLLRKGTELSTQRSMLYLHQREMVNARQELQWARYQVEMMEGTLLEQSGNLIEARAHYQAAFTIAEVASNLQGMAKAQENLGNLAGRQQQIEIAVAHYDAALTHYDQLGDRYGRECVRSNLAAAYIQAGHFAEVIEPAQRALIFFKSMGNAFWTALNASNLAEAHAALQNFAEAEQHAMLVLDQEEPHSHPYALFTMGNVRQQQGKLEEAGLYFTQARQLAELNSDSYLLAYALGALGEIYKEEGDLQAAERAITQAETIFHDLNLPQEVARISNLLSAEARLE